MYFFVHYQLYHSYLAFGNKFLNPRKCLVWFTHPNNSINFSHKSLIYSLNRAGALRGSVKKERLPISEKWAKECLSLPVYPYMKLSDAEKVVKTIKKYFNY